MPGETLKYPETIYQGKFVENWDYPCGSVTISFHKYLKWFLVDHIHLSYHPAFPGSLRAKQVHHVPQIL